MGWLFPAGGPQERRRWPRGAADSAGGLAPGRSASRSRHHVRRRAALTGTACSGAARTAMLARLGLAPVRPCCAWAGIWCMPSPPAACPAAGRLLIAGQAAAPPGAWAAVTPKPPPLPAAGAIQPSAACTQQPESSEWASAAAKSAGTDREADHICDRGRQCGRHGAYPAGTGGVRADAPGHFRPAAGGSSCRRSRRWHDGRILPGGSGQLPLIAARVRDKVGNRDATVNYTVELHRGGSPGRERLSSSPGSCGRETTGCGGVPRLMPLGREQVCKRQFLS